MEYPLGANIASGACKPTHRPAVRSGIQNPVLRHPRFDAGSQKRHDTAHVEVFSCARRPTPPEPSDFFTQFLPESHSASPNSDYLARRSLNVTCGAEKTPGVAY